MTVGYGDRYPVTGTGRLIAVALMLCGTALLGVVTAMLAAWFLEHVARAEHRAQVATRRDVKLWPPKLPDCGRNSRPTGELPGDADSP